MHYDILHQTRVKDFGMFKRLFTGKTDELAIAFAVAFSILMPLFLGFSEMP